MALNHNALAQHDNCQTCAYVLGGDSEHKQLHCGLVYYQMPAQERHPTKLANYPKVAPDQVCTHWSIKI